MKKYIVTCHLLFMTFAFASSEDHHHHDHHHKKETTTNLEAHVHGEVHCSVAVEGKEIYLELRSPAESFIGFEHRPKTREEVETWEQLKKSWKLNLLDSFEVLEKECQVKESQIKLHVDEQDGHAQISADAYLKCSDELQQSKLKIDLRENFKSIYKVHIEILPSGLAPYNKTLTGKDKSIELSL